MTLERVPDHRDRGLSLLITQYQELPRLRSLLGALLDEVQVVEDAAWDVILGRLVDDAEGAQLDTIGRIVGQPRIGDDEEFRLYIKARITINSSDGTGDDVMQVAEVLLEGKPWSYEETYPASIIIETFEAERAATIAHLLRLARAGGVGFGYHYSTEPEAEAFSFPAGDDAEEDSASGFGDDDPDTGTGGAWADTY